MRCVSSVHLGVSVRSYIGMLLSLCGTHVCHMDSQARWPHTRPERQSTCANTRCRRSLSGGRQSYACGLIASTHKCLIGYRGRRRRSLANHCLVYSRIPGAAISGSASQDAHCLWRSGALADASFLTSLTSQSMSLLTDCEACGRSGTSRGWGRWCYLTDLHTARQSHLDIGLFEYESLPTRIPCSRRCRRCQTHPSQRYHDGQELSSTSLVVLARLLPSTPMCPNACLKPCCIWCL